MYGMRYGTLPIVRRVGGLADTVTAISDATKSDESGTGFVFENATVADFAEAISSADKTYRDPASWRRVQARAMTRDFSWRRSADRYLRLYRALVPLAPDESKSPAGQPVSPIRMTGT